MRSDGCSRLWEVEAHRDGRLSAAAHASLDAHVATCRVCRGERRRLDALSKSLAVRQTPDEVSVRRLRQRVLMDADVLLRRAVPTEVRRFLPAAVSVVLLVVLATIVKKLREPNVGPATSSAIILASTGARWSRHAETGIERVDLEEGVLQISVHRTPNEPRLVVHVPDGEIEDFGTRFVVAVSSGRTAEISVSEGTVVLEQPPRPDTVLAAGSRWAPPVPSSRTEEPAQPDAPQRPSVLAARASDEELRTPRHERASQAPPPSSSKAPQSDDERSEDAAYLRVVALLREGRDEEARISAADYMARFPNGFRRPEIERVIRSKPPSSAPAASRPAP